jgi:hypothetical protein
MSAKDGGPAFPQIETDEEVAYKAPGIFPHTYSYGGMSLRDYFAAQAMAATIANPEYASVVRQPGSESPIARAAYLMADAMLAERSKP